MKQVTVHIATTDGPAEIERLTAEDPEVRSVVCLGGKAVALPISADYDAFVRKPTGVIEAYFGHGAWRIDLARPISGGMSWQLGAFIAHAGDFDDGGLTRDRDVQVTRLGAVASHRQPRVGRVSGRLVREGLAHDRPIRVLNGFDQVDRFRDWKFTFPVH